MEDFPALGRMLVVREEYAFCACDDGFIWTIAFDEVREECRVIRVSYSVILSRSGMRTFSADKRLPSLDT